MKRILSALTALTLAAGSISALTALSAGAYDGGEIVVNGDFEAGEVADWSSNYLKTFSQDDVTADPLGQNGNSLHVTGRWNQWSTPRYALPDKFEGGMTYRISADVMYNEKTADDSGNEYDVADSLDFQLELGTEDNDGRAKYVRQNQTVTKETWTTLTAEITLPYDLSGALYLSIETDSGSFPANRVSFYTDNVSVKEINVSDNAEYALKKINILEYFPDYRIKDNVTLPSNVGGYNIAWQSSKEDVLSINDYVTSYTPTETDTIVKLTASSGGAENAYYLESKRSSPAPSLLESEGFTSKPALGWNSFDGYTCAVTEEQVLENARFMAGTGDINLSDYGYGKTLKDMGYEYVVVDQAWYMNPKADSTYELPMMSTHGKAAFHVNENGYWVVDEKRFPSAKKPGAAAQTDTSAEKSDEIIIVDENNGFKALADEIHAMGLKFGIHLQRGVPKIAVEKKLPIRGCDGLTVDAIAELDDTCGWNDMCYGIDMTKPGAQEYLNGEFERYAQWGVDFVKIDDLSRPYDETMVEGYRNAIDNCGRAIYFSTSPGATPVEEYDHVKTHANMWRIIDDFWDDWGGESDVDRSNGLNYVINVFQDWTDKITDYHYPDGDMIPFGQLTHAWAPGYYCNFTDAEKRTVMTVWAMNKSPIMLGGRLRGYLGKSDQTEFSEGSLGYADKENYDDLKYVINSDMLNINQSSVNTRLVARSNDYPVWTSESADGSERYIAFVNSADTDGKTPHTFSLNLKDIDNTHSYASAKEVWTGEDIAITDDTISVTLEEHDSALIILKPEASDGYPYEISNLEIRSLSGEVLTAAPADKGFIARVTFKENYKREAEDYIFVAVYGKNGEFLSLNYIQSDFAENRPYSVGVHIPAQTEEIGSVKAYIWDSFNGITPLAESAEIKQ